VAARVRSRGAPRPGRPDDRGRAGADGRARLDAPGRRPIPGAWRSDPDSSAVVRPSDPALPTFVALHAAIPALDGNTRWRLERDLVRSACGDADVVVAGDFNGTLDDLGDVGGCRDAAAERSAADVGIWPTGVPPLLGIPIDHVLVGRGRRVLSSPCSRPRRARAHATGRCSPCCGAGDHDPVTDGRDPSRPHMRRA